MRNILLSFLFAVIYVTTNGQAGTLDSTFGKDGIVRTDFGDGVTYYHSIAVQADGKIVTAGFSGSWNYSFAVARYNSNGSLDMSFSDDGKTTFQFGFDRAIGNALAIQPDGKIIVAGFTYNQAQADFAVARLNQDGSLDNSFSDDGKLSIDLRGDDDVASVVKIQVDGKIVVAGSSKQGAAYDFATIRLNNDGTTDRSFSDDGMVFTGFGLAHSSIQALIIQPDKNIIAVGSNPPINTSNPVNTNFVLVRYHSDGSQDYSFGIDGIATTDFFGGDDAASSAVLQSDGKIVVAGSIFRPGHGSDFGVARFNSNGSPDNSFSGDGKLNLDVGSTSETASSVGVQTNGKIILAGYNANAFNDFALARINSDGTIDNTFSDDGKLVLNFGSGEDLIEDLAIANDRLYVAGRTQFVIPMGIVATFRIEDNKPPIAGAWFQKYYTPTSALLAAWGSYDPESGPISYSWQKTAGPAGSGLLYSNSASPIVTGLVIGTYMFKLTVTDQYGSTGNAMLSFSVEANLPPIAGAWLQKYYSPTSVLLAAWDSHDPEGGPITYSWEKTAGPDGSTLLYWNSASPVVNGLVNGVYTYRLTVTDDHGATGWKDLTFMVSGVPLSGSRAQSLIPADENSNGHDVNRFAVYPNPVADILNFRWHDEYRGDALLTVFNLSGQKIKEIRIYKTSPDYNSSIELTGLKAGRYYLHIRNQSKTFIKPFMKE